eukprot:TRINITY_DN5989_c0_g5_i1.p1 TRINITY_DN5989_c0_g5~~TRINITY_DN5989_c0_g5_i1.p1  ORF type:complete len:324 (+),score=52.64 TRINITY_DN5989_c0_g5_i1:62-1033(+)
MAEGYEKFLEFDWSDERWRTYLNGLYPPPNQLQIAKFKKKWYKKNIDSNFDDSYEPPAPAASASGGSYGPDAEEYPGGEGVGSLPEGLFSDGRRWAVLGQKTSICLFAYSAAMIMAVGSTAFVFPAYQAHVMLVLAFFLEIIAKYGVKMKKEFFHAILLDDIGVMPIMAVTLLMPGLHPIVRTLALASPFLTALVSFAQICKHKKKMPKVVRDFFSPLAQASAREQVFKVRAHCEVALGFMMIIGVFGLICAPVTVILYWNFIMMRYMMSAPTVDSFKIIDTHLSGTIGKVPGLGHGYRAFKDWLYGFVDPKSSSSGKMCTIL